MIAAANTRRPCLHRVVVALRSSYGCSLASMLAFPRGSPERRWSLSRGAVDGLRVRRCHPRRVIIRLSWSCRRVHRHRDGLGLRLRRGLGRDVGGRLAAPSDRSSDRRDASSSCPSRLPDSATSHPSTPPTASASARAATSTPVVTPPRGRRGRRPASRRGGRGVRSGAEEEVRVSSSPRQISAGRAPRRPRGAAG